MDLFKDIIDFHEKFDLPKLEKPGFLTEDVMDFRVDFLEEELNELRVAYTQKDLHDTADALIDIVYVALGTAYLMGIDANACWKLVHEANMKKVKAKSADESKRNSSYDVVKPSDWQSPDLSSLL